MGLLPEKMLRVRIIGSNYRKDSIISALHDAGVIQLEAVSGELAQAMGLSKPGDLYRQVNRALQIYRGYESILPSVPVKTVREFDDVGELLWEASSIDLEGELKMIKATESDILAEIKEIQNRLDAVEALNGLDYDLSIFNGSAISSFIAKELEDGETEGAIRARLPEATLFKLPNGQLVVTIPVKKDAELARIASELNFKISHIPEMSGKPAAYTKAMQEKLAKDRERLAEINSNLMEISEEHYAKIAQIREQLEIENRKLEVADKLSSTQDSFIMEGWIPRKHYDSLTKLVNDAAEGSVIIKTIETKEEPPTLLSNPKILQPFEFFVRFYSLPQESEWDPTLIFSIVFPFFFGIMVGDWGYGLVILLVALWMIRKLTKPGAKTIMPKKLTNFALTIFGRNALLVLAKALIPASLVAIAAGAIFNNFFGFPLFPLTILEAGTGFGGAHIGAFPPTPAVLFHVDFTIPKLLLFTGYVGLFMVTFGLVLGLLNEMRLKHRKGMVSKVGWLLVAWGLALFGLNLITGLPVPPLASIAAAVVGILLVLVSEGPLGLIEIPSIISHILSYTRILGILLASVYLAQVIDLIFLKGIAKSPLFGLIGVIVLVLGQAFNLAIAVMEPGIQGARLIYVEFFSKFYRGNGKIFHPFSTKRRFTAAKFNLESPRK